MEQKQNALNGASEIENNDAAAKKHWVTPELRVLPVPTKTQTSKYFVDPNKENSLYRKTS